MSKILKPGLSAALLTAFVITLAPGAGGATPYLPRLGHSLSMKDGAEILKVRRGRGADDGATHDLGDDKGGRRGGKGRGADDAPGDDRGGRKGGRGRGRDDGPNHT